MKRLVKLALVAVGALTVVLLALVAIVVRRMPSAFDIAVPFDPECATEDFACRTWMDFRLTHPYPYQRVMAKDLGPRGLILIVSEPPPVMSKEEFVQEVRSIFEGSLTSLQQRRWSIGVDGWVEDVVLTLKPRGDGLRVSGDDLLADPLFADQIALLHLTMFDTTFGATVDSLESAMPSTERLPNLRVTPRDLRDWLGDSQLGWYRVDENADPVRVTAEELQNETESGVFVSSDQTVVALVAPTTHGKVTRETIESLRVPFRMFAVMTDVVIGGAWNDKRLVLLGREREVSPDLMPPLRFETFAVLAKETSDELQQSYERRTIFAGKLTSGEYGLRDWAPIYLSEPLRDTEFGALLNVTDQILKSWSSAGNVEYVYFAYPERPSHFPFQGTALAEVLHRDTGSTTVLFNWNTSGSAVVFEDSSQKLLAPTRTGSLPVTYGSDKPGSKTVETGHLLRYEEQGYDYFSELKDPNLARVVEYTLVYQMLRAAVTTDKDLPVSDPGPEGLTAQGRRASPALVAATRELMDDVETGRIKGTEEVAKVAELIRKVKAALPAASVEYLPDIMVDPASTQAIALRVADHERVLHAIPELHSQEAQLRADIDAYNKEVDKLRSMFASDSSVPSKLARRLQATRRKLDERQRRFNEEQASLEASLASPLVDDLRTTLVDLAAQTAELDGVRQDYMKEQIAPASGWIRTPSIVVSWNKKQLLNSVGGHNLTARAIRFEPSSAVADVGLTETADGFVLRYNPARVDAVAAKASELARAVEHGKISNAAALEAMVGQAPPPRMRSQALDVRPRTPEEVPKTLSNWGGRLGRRVYSEKRPFVDDLRKMAEQNDCCAFVVAGENQVRYVAERSPHPPPPVRVIEIRDSPSLVKYIGEVASRKQPPRSVVFLDAPEGHVKALTLSLEGAPGARPRVSRWARLLAGASGEAKRADVIVSTDLRGRRSVLEVIGSLKAEGRTLFGMLGRTRSEAGWRQAAIRTLDAEQTSALLKVAGWDSARDGLPTAVVVSFRAEGGAPALDVSIAAGFARPPSPGTDTLRTIHDSAVQAASDQHTSLAGYLMTIKNELSQRHELQLKRLAFVVREGTNRVLFARQERPDNVRPNHS